MITPKLEELILCGKAFFKTAVIGGSKTTIDIDNDRFIIITDITYLPYQNTTAPIEQGTANYNMQLSIYGERGFNHYLFANTRLQSSTYFNSVDNETLDRQQIMPMNPQSINCYLLHTTQVGFSFISSYDYFPNSTIGVAPYNNPGYPPPLDYGIDGMVGAIPVNTDVQINFTNQVVNRVGGIGIGTAVSQQIQIAAEFFTRPVVLNNRLFPIANINYIEILGQPNNIGI